MRGIVLEKKLLVKHEVKVLLCHLDNRRFMKYICPDVLLTVSNQQFYNYRIVNEYFTTDTDREAQPGR